MKRQWRDIVRRYEQELSQNAIESSVLPLSVTCDDFEVNALLAVKAALRIATQIGPQRAGRTRQREVEIASEDGSVVGRLDKVHWEDGAAVITDLKTGKPKDAGGSVRKELLVQLKLYAYLIHERDGKWPTSIRIQPLTGEAIEIDFMPLEIIDLAACVKAALTEANALIGAVMSKGRDESELALPSPETCRFCTFRISCPAYWGARKGWNPDEAPPDVEGLLSSVISQTGGFSLLGLNMNGSPATVRGFRPAFIRGSQRELQIGRMARMCELRRERAPMTYSCRPFSAFLQT